MISPGAEPSILEQRQVADPQLFDSQKKSEDTVVKRSWVSVASRPQQTKFEYEVSTLEGRNVISVPDDVFVDSPPLWDEFLVGRFASTVPHVAKVHVIVNKIWNLGDKSIRIDAYEVNDTSIKFRIRNLEARQRVLRRGMWNICEIPMIVAKWTPIAEDAQPEIKSMPMWVKMKHVPNSMFSWKGLSLLASPVGLPIRLHQETEIVTNFEEAKIFVDVDLRKDVPKSFCFKIQEEEVTVMYEYLWLPLRCGSCKKWGHSDEGCLLNFKQRNSESIPLTVESGQLVHGEKENLNLDVQVEHTSEREEGEIVSILPATLKDSDDTWTTVSPSTCKNSTPRTKALVYGEVRIATQSTFDVLRNLEQDDQLADDSHQISVNDSTPIVASDSGLTSPDNTENQEEQLIHTSLPGISSVSTETMITPQVMQAQQSECVEEAVTRTSLPRHSKNAHKLLSDKSRKAKETIPKGYGRRIHHKNN